MKYKKPIVSTLAVFAFVFLFDFLYHHILLQGTYEQTAYLWRTKADCLISVALLSQFLFAFFLAGIFCKWVSDKSMRGSLNFGLMLGLLLGSLQLMSYAYMPIPFLLAMAWVVGALVKAAGSCAMLSLISSKLD